MKRVIIVEDQTAVREMIARIVEADPEMTVIGETGDGETAVRDCLREKPDLVVLDIMLPGLNGTEVIRRLTKQAKETRILVFSGYQNPVLVRELLQAGAHGFVEKTASLEELQKGIATVNGGGTFFGPEVARILREAIANPSSPAGPSLEILTPRERQILQLIAQSYSTKEVAAKLTISVKTAENHRTNLMKKLNLHDVASLTRFAIEHGLVETFPRLQFTASR